MSLKLLSKHRGSLMAIAMLWIAYYHLYYGFPIKAINFIVHSLGYLGIDCFLFLSGFGIYYSLSKESNYITYIKKRLKRILPYCIPIYIFYFFIKKETLLYTIVDCLGLSIIFRADFVNWFTSLILLLYVVTPLYNRLFKKNKEAVTLISIALVVIVCVVLNRFEVTYVYFRITLYVLGYYFGYLTKCNKEKKILNWGLVVLSFFGFFLIYYLTHNYRNDIIYIYPSIVIVPGFLLFVSWIIDKIKFVQKPLSFIGEYTYQFYLIQKPLLDLITANFYSKFFVAGINYDFLFNHFTIIIAFIVSLIYKKLIDIVINGIIEIGERI